MGWGIEKKPLSPVATRCRAGEWRGTTWPPRSHMVEEPPVNGGHRAGRPRVAPIAEFVGRYLAANGDTRTVVADTQARYFGASFDNRGLTPVANPHLGRRDSRRGSAGRRCGGRTAGRRSRAGGVEHRETSEPSRGALRGSARHTEGICRRARRNRPGGPVTAQACPDNSSTSVECQCAYFTNQDNELDEKVRKVASGASV